jgi:protease-4
MKQHHLAGLFFKHGAYRMFTRRHPYLFFMLAMAGLGVVSLVVVAIIAVVLNADNVEFAGEKVGVIPIIGTLADSRPILQQIKTFREAKAVKAIVIRVDSPGGSVGPSQEIYREIRKTVKDKKVVVSMGAVAASGGYYLSAAANKIVANPGTITGSIGVIMGYTNFEELLHKIGLVPIVIKSGEYKDLGSPVRPMTTEEKELLHAVTMKIHRQFVNAIAQGRNMEVARVDAVADGRILTGEEAMELGLVDRLGNFDDAVQWAGELAGLTGDIETVYPKEDKRTLLQFLAESTLQLINSVHLRSRMEPQLRLE